MPKFSRKENAEWIEKSKEMEKECSQKVKEVAENYIQNPESIAEALAFGSKFYDYSLKNNQLIYAQNHGAQYVQSFPAWKKMGYTVKKGEQGMKIWVPVKTTLLKIDDDFIKVSDATKEQKEDYRKGKIEGIISTRFKLGTVFDIAQTTYPKEQYPELFSVGYPSKMHEDICKGLMDYSEKYVHCSVKVEDLSSITLRGYFNRNEKEIVLNSSLDGTQKLSTMAHELGHAIRHSLPNGTSMHRKEFEADAISVIVESGFGLELTDARKGHLASHYDKYCEELKEELGESYSEMVLEDKINEVLSSVYGTYSACIDNINECVEKYVSQERLLQYEQDKAYEESMKISEAHEQSSELENDSKEYDNEEMEL